MKKSLRHVVLGSAAALLTSGSIQAAPFITIADTVDVFFLGRASVDYRTNLFNTSLKREDVLFTVSPGFEARLGRTENASLSLIFREDFLIYNKYTGQNTQLANVILRGAYKGGPVELEGGFSFIQTQTNMPDTFYIGAPSDLFVKRDLYNAHARVKYDYSPKFWMKGGVVWDRTEYTNNDKFGDNYANKDVYTLPVDFFYRYSPKFSVGLGYRYRHTRAHATPHALRNGATYNDHFFSVALDGEVTSKLQANANIGYQLRDNAGGTHGQFAIDATLTYEVHEKLEVFVGGSNDFNTTSSGGSSEVISTHVGANYLISSFVSATGQLRYDHTKYSYSGRKDNTTYASLALNYAPNTYLTFSAGYGYTDNGSNVAAASFMGHSINFTASLRY